MRIFLTLVVLAITAPAMSNDIPPCSKDMTATLKQIDAHQAISDLLLDQTTANREMLTAVKNKLEKDIHTSCESILGSVTNKDLPGTCTYLSNDKMKLSSIYLFEKQCWIFR